MGPDRLALEAPRASPHEAALGGRYAEMVGPKMHQAFDEPHRRLHRTLKAGHGFGAKELLRRRLLWRLGLRLGACRGRHRRSGWGRGWRGFGLAHGGVLRRRCGW